jgi:hypothetical protein
MKVMSLRLTGLVKLASVASFCSSCSDGQRLDLGEDQPMRVAGATYYRSPVDETDTTAAPDVVSATFVTRVLEQGNQDKTFKGTLGAGAMAVAIRLNPENAVGGSGHWLLSANAPFVENPEFPSFSTSLSFANSVLPGTYLLSLSAINANGLAGPTRDVQFLVRDRQEVTGRLVFALDWSTNADLDVHVVTPDGNEIYMNDVTDAAGTDATGGALDFDSNGDCRIDGRRNENVVWSAKPAAGRYTVRVDAFSLCDQIQTYWRVTAIYKGKLVAATTGVMLPSDTRGQHGRGAGLTAMLLDVD